MKKVVTLNDLPRFSPWPARLLGIDKWDQRQKTPEEVTREFEHDKWGHYSKGYGKSAGKLLLTR